MQSLGPSPQTRPHTGGGPAGDRVLLHVGVPKTGTTMIQAALAQLSEQEDGYGLSRWGVLMPGSPLEQSRATLELLGQRMGWNAAEGPVTRGYWEQLVGRTRLTRGTAFISSEFLCEADTRTIRQIDQELGDDNVHAVITLRPLSRILPSAWQQYLKSGHQLTYERWLKAVLASPPKQSVTPSFWRRHQQAEVVERWAAELGPEKVTVIVLDPVERALLPRAFDQLLGLPAGTLEAMPVDRANRSMTLAEAELFRRVNVALRRHQLPWPDYSHLIRYGAIMRTVEKLGPPVGSPTLTTPAWAVERAVELGEEYAERIAALVPSGLRVVGALDRLSEAPDPPAARTAGPASSEGSSGSGAPAAGPEDRVLDLIPVEVGVQALLGAVARAATGRAYFDDEQELVGVLGLAGAGRDRLGDTPVGRLTSRQLAGVLGRRLRHSVQRRSKKLSGGARSRLSRSPGVPPTPEISPASPTPSWSR